jgi:putative Mg2+ transporter-C (MgtC) family protein
MHGDIELVAPINPAWVISEDWLSVTWRLILASLAGGFIGWNRQIVGKAAGLRTHMLVSLGAALFIIVPLSTGAPTLDAVSRGIQGVATGIGFLGAGEIIHRARVPAHQPPIQGLTSAAAIWVTAALGIVAACGMWQICLIGTLLTLIILSGAKRLERFVRVDHDAEE